MAAINVTNATHAQVRSFARKLLADDVETNIGDVGDHLWDFVQTHHTDAFEAYVRKNVASRG